MPGHRTTVYRALRCISIYRLWAQPGNILMAAVLANGTTSIKNAAIEPEITALIDFLRSMGADIEGKGTSHLIIQGKKELKPANMQVIPDRIEAGTFLVTAAATGGKITLVNAEPDHLTEVLIKLEETGAELSTEGNRIHISMQKRPPIIDLLKIVKKDILIFFIYMVMDQLILDEL